MRTLVVLLLAAAASAVGNDGAVKPPDPKQKAKEMLAAAAEIVGGAKPEVHAAALMRIGDAYTAIDNKKALEYLKQAFTSAGAIPPEDDSSFRYSTQSEIVRMVSQLDLNGSIEMLKAMAVPSKGPDNRTQAGAAVIHALIQHERIDAAIELLDTMSGLGANLFNGARMIFLHLPSDDPRRMRVWTWAVAANAAKPDRGFSEMLSRCWKELPQQTAETALRTVLDGILGMKTEIFKDTFMSTSVMTSKGIVSFPSQQDTELFDVMFMVRAVDPQRAGDILGTRPELRDALSRFPMGTASMTKEGEGYTSFSMVTDSKRGIQEGVRRQNVMALNESRSAEVLEALKKDFDKALALVPSIPDPAKQADVLGTIARTTSENDPAKARSALNKCLLILDTIKRPQARISTWDAVAEAANRIHDDALFQLAFDRMLADAAELYKQDSDADHPNKAWRDRWPSTMAYRRVARRAVDAKGVEADLLLLKITDTDLHLFTKIEMADALLGRKRGDTRAYGGAQK